MASYEPTMDSIPQSVSGTYSADGGSGGYKVSGSVYIGHLHENDFLYLTVLKAKNLTWDSKTGYPSPYVKAYILPDGIKLKTEVKKNTPDPTFNNMFKLSLPEDKINHSTVCISAWDWDKHGRHLFLGEINLFLRSLKLGKYQETWYKLRQRNFKATDEKCGHLSFSIMYDKGEENLCVYILKANNLRQKDPKMCNIFVRIMLLPELKEDRTIFAQNTLNPEWNEGFIFKDVPLETLGTNMVLELSVWHYNGFDCSEFIGCVRLGPPADWSKKISWMDSTDQEFDIWMDVITHPGSWIDSIVEMRPFIANRWEYTPSPKLTCTSKTLSLRKKRKKKTLVEKKAGDNITIIHEEEAPDYEISGRLLVRIDYEENKLMVQILRGDNLAAVEQPSNYSNPYIKMYLLQEGKKVHEWRTEVKKETLNPLFNETIKYNVKGSELNTCTLTLIVCHHMLSGLDKFLGSVKLDHSAFYPKLQWHSLTTTDISKGAQIAANNITTRSWGQITFSLKFERQDSLQESNEGTLHVFIADAKGLRQTSQSNKSSCYVEVTFIPTMFYGQTSNVLNDTTPVWNEHMEIKDVTLENLSKEHGLKIVLVDTDENKSFFIGGVLVCPSPNEYGSYVWMDSNLLESTHWKLMLSNPGEWVECCHMLRTNIDIGKTSNLIKPNLCDPPEEDKEHNTCSEIVIAIKFQTTDEFNLKGKLYVGITEARQLHRNATDGVFVDCDLYPHLQTGWKERATPILGVTINPVWEETFIFEDLYLDEVHNKRVLDISCWASNGGYATTYLGRICLGNQPEHCTMEEIRHWKAIFTNPKKWVEDIHTLKF